MNIRSVGAELFHVDGQTHRETDRQTGGQLDGQTYRHDEANSPFSQFCEHALKLNVGESNRTSNIGTHTHTHTPSHTQTLLHIFTLRNSLCFMQSVYKKDLEE